MKSLARGTCTATVPKQTYMSIDATDLYLIWNDTLHCQDETNRQTHSDWVTDDSVDPAAAVLVRFWYVPAVVANASLTGSPQHNKNSLPALPSKQLPSSPSPHLIF